MAQKFQNLFWLSFGILLISFFFSFFLIWPKYQELIILRKLILRKKIELETQSQYFEELYKTSEKLKKYEDSLKKVDLALPSFSSLPELFNFIQKTSTQSGLFLDKIGTSGGERKKREAGGEIRETNVSLVVIGDHSRFKNFLTSLEESARLIEVENISFSSAKDGLVTFNLQIKVYSY